MRNIFCTFILIGSLSISLSGQFGVTARYQLNDSKDWNKAFDNVEDVLSTSIEYGVNYWLRLKNKRVEFLPELTYAPTSAFYDNVNNAIGLNSAKRTSFGLGVNTHIYPLDFSGDCNCPTFSKDGNLLSKGFHWIVNTGLVMHNVETMHYAPVQTPAEDLSKEINGQVTFRFGIGAGLDIGINELMTLTPHATYGRNIPVKASTIELVEAVVEEGPEIQSALDQFSIGLRLTLRPDYLKTKRGLYRRR